MEPGTWYVLNGASSNREGRSCGLGEVVVKLATIDGAELDGFLGTFAVPSKPPGSKGRSYFGDSGDKEGKLVSDLSEIDDAELDM
jgi:hypothetical protein